MLVYELDQLISANPPKQWGEVSKNAPLHSLLIPTRNRPELIDFIVSYYLQSPRDDIEVVVADASDDHEILKTKLSSLAGDPRLRILDHSPKSLGKVQSMRENWTRRILACRGKWITVVGDDDMCDPNVVYFIEKVESIYLNIEAISWQRMTFCHGLREKKEAATIPLNFSGAVIDSRKFLEKQIEWPSEKGIPHFGATIYHGALHRSLIARIREEREGKLFRFATIDWDMSWTATHFTLGFVSTERPFTIMGYQEKSNSNSVRNLKGRVRTFNQWMEEDRALDGISLEVFRERGVDPLFAMVLPVMILGFRNAFAQYYGYSHIKLNKQNFLNTLIYYCRTQDDEDSFLWFREELIKFAKAFMDIELREDQIERMNLPEPMYYGLKDNMLIFDRSIVDYDLRKFAPLSFRLIPHWTFCFSPSGNRA